MSKQTITSGKRKTSVARATIKKGEGRVKINGVDLESFTPEISRLKIQVPLLLAMEDASKCDISVRVAGGGFNSMAEASALAIARGLVKQNKKLETTFLNYDRQLLVADVRRREVRKPNRHGKARSKRQKSYR
ncbi:30S ribosomal protein S9 [Candidatus Woesearchaeota archaeon]|nr:30S ribosomal protein S9 [Candidatus Woesearchaeota archaeon]